MNIKDQPMRGDERLLIRFENHLFYHFWGQNHPEQFVGFFQFDRSTSWKGHEWRPSEEMPWPPVHQGDQSIEWQVFEFARWLDENAAMQSVSMGAPQIMGFNYAVFGYPSVQDMFAILADPNFGEHSNAILLFDFIIHEGLVDALRKEDFYAFATAYNGTGEASLYESIIQETLTHLRQ